MYAAALAVSHIRAGGNVVADRKIGDIAVVKIGKPLVPVVALQSPGIKPRDQRAVRLDAHLDLEGEGSILKVAALGRRAPVHDEQRNGPSIQEAVDRFDPRLSDQASNLQAAAVRQVVRSRFPDRNRGKIDIHGLRAGMSVPGLVAIPARRGGGVVLRLLFARLGFVVGVLPVGRVVAPRDGDSEVPRLGVHQDAQTHGRRQQHPFSAAALGRARIVAALHGLGGIVQLLFGVLGTLRFGSTGGRQKPSHVPERWRLRQAFVLQCVVFRSRADQI